MITSIKHWNIIKESLKQDETPAILKIKDDKAELVDTKYWYVDSVLDIITDPKDVDVYENLINASTDMNNKPIKQGDELYLSVLLKPRNNSTVLSGGEPGIVKVKVVKAWYGLSKLGELQKKGKLH